MTLTSNDVTSTIQLALAPVFLLTAVVALITAINGRLIRIFDRMRFIHRELLSPVKPAPSLEAHYRTEFKEVRIRGRMCEIAFFLDVLSGVLISLTVLELFFFQNGVKHVVGSYMVGTFVAGVFSFMTALIVVLIEVVYASRSVSWDLSLDPEEKV